MNFRRSSTIIEADMAGKKGKRPLSFKDHRKSDNPFKFRYGKRWKTMPENHILMRPFCCVTTMIEHIIRELENVMKGAKHEDD